MRPNPVPCHRSNRRKLGCKFEGDCLTTAGKPSKSWPGGWRFMSCAECDAFEQETDDRLLRQTLQVFNGLNRLQRRGQEMF